MAELLEGWADFNVAMVGATAALAGLLIVAMSVNISTIMSSPTLPARAASSIAALVLAIVAGALGLVPERYPVRDPEPERRIRHAQGDDVEGVRRVLGPHDLVRSGADELGDGGARILECRRGGAGRNTGAAVDGGVGLADE